MNAKFPEKKKPLLTIDAKLIASFVYQMKGKGETRYFHKNFGYCVELNYWMRLLLLEFMGVVYTHATYHPIFPTLRHESRYKRKTAFIAKAASEEHCALSHSAKDGNSAGCCATNCSTSYLITPICKRWQLGSANMTASQVLVPYHPTLDRKSHTSELQ